MVHRISQSELRELGILSPKFKSGEVKLSNLKDIGKLKICQLKRNKKVNGEVNVCGVNVDEVFLSLIQAK